MKRLKADVVVISAGTAGLPAAVTAAEGESSVIILEKTGRTGGSANRGNMLFAVEDIPRGDVNNDGQIDVSDVLLCVNIIIHLYEPHYPEFLRADYNEDGSVSVLDVVSIINVIVKGP